MSLKRVLVHTRKAVRTLGGEVDLPRTENPYADAIISKMEEASNKIMQKTEDILFKKKSNSINLKQKKHV